MIMKKSILTICFLCVTLFSFAQQHAFKLNAAAYAFKSIELSYEEIAHKHTSVEISLALLGYKADTTVRNYKNFEGYNLDIKYKFYFSSKKGNFRGLYLAPSGDFSMPKSLKTDLSYYGGTATLGYQFILGGDAGVVIDISAGESYYTGISKNKGISDDPYTGFRPNIGFRIGYAFDTLSGM